MQRKRLLGIGAAVLLASGLWVGAIESAAIQCGGSFVPSLNCIIPGFWNYTRVDPTSGLSVPFQAGGSDVTGIVSRSVDLSNAQILALNMTPVTILPAPGNGYYYDIVAVDYAFKYTATYSAGTDLRLYFGNRTSGSAASVALTVSGFLTGVSANKATRVGGTTDNTTLPITNLAVVLMEINNTLFTGGNAANSLRVVVWYRRVATGL